MLADIRAKDRATEKLNRHRWAVITLARHSAIKAVKADFRAQGRRLGDVSSKDIHILADEYLAAHRERLVAEAKELIATSPYLASWRSPGL